MFSSPRSSISASRAFLRLRDTNEEEFSVSTNAGFVKEGLSSSIHTFTQWSIISFCSLWRSSEKGCKKILHPTYHLTEFFILSSFCSSRANEFQHRNQNPIVSLQNITIFNVLLNIHNQFNDYNIELYSWDLSAYPSFPSIVHSSVHAISYYKRLKESNTEWESMNENVWMKTFIKSTTRRLFIKQRRDIRLGHNLETVLCNITKLYTV